MEALNDREHPEFKPRSQRSVEINRVDDKVVASKEEIGPFGIRAWGEKILDESLVSLRRDKGEVKSPPSSLREFVKALKTIVKEIEKGHSEEKRFIDTAHNNTRLISSGDSLERFTEEFKGPESQPYKQSDGKPIILDLPEEGGRKHLSIAEKRIMSARASGNQDANKETGELFIMRDGDRARPSSTPLPDSAPLSPLDEKTLLGPSIREMSERQRKLPKGQFTSDLVFHSTQAVSKKGDNGARLQSTSHASNVPDLEFARRVAEHTARAVRNGEQSVKLRLHPPELGRVKIELHVDPKDHLVRATFIADAKEVKGLLEQHHYILRDTLAQHGYHLQDFSVHQSPPDSDVGNGMGWSSSWEHHGSDQQANQEGHLSSPQWSFIADEESDGERGSIEGVLLGNNGLSIRV